MSEAYIDKNYVYAVARVRGQELRLFNKQSLSELASVKHSNDVIRLLKEKGWGKENEQDIISILNTEREKLWEFIDEIVPEKSIFNVFRLSNDYHNLKAAIKESTMEYPYEGIYIKESTMDTENIIQSIKNRAYSELPEGLREVAENAHSVFLQTNDGQLCDIIVDKACLEAIHKAGIDSKNDFLKMYAELVCVSSNIKVCVRSSKTGKDKAFLEKAVVDCDTLDSAQLIQATIQGEDAICSYLQNTDYLDAVPEIKKSLTSFEKWCDNLIISRMKSQLYESFGLGPIAAYILAKEYEIKTVRIIYTGIQNKFSDEMIKERVRETYV